MMKSIPAIALCLLFSSHLMAEQPSGEVGQGVSFHIECAKLLDKKPEERTYLGQLDDDFETFTGHFKAAQAEGKLRTNCLAAKNAVDKIVQWLGLAKDYLEDEMPGRYQRSATKGVKEGLGSLSQVRQDITRDLSINPADSNAIQVKLDVDDTLKWLPRAAKSHYLDLSDSELKSFSSLLSKMLKLVNNDQYTKQPRNLAEIFEGFLNESDNFEDSSELFAAQSAALDKALEP